MASPAPACLQAIKDANRKWPSRKKASDGIMGDARHQKTKSDHNLGNAFDLTHDPASGCDGHLIAAAAIVDPRVKYVIWNKRIFNRQRGDTAFRPYKGKNPHTKHCHVSVLAGSRGDIRPWAWAPGGRALAAAVERAPTETSASTASQQVSRNVGASHPGAASRVFPGTILKRGSRGDLVRLVQERLRKLQWDIVPDGAFGDVTARVVRAFQKRHDLDPDGEVGRRTWNALFN